MQDVRDGSGGKGAGALTDLELLLKARRGEGAAFAELVERHAGALYRLAYALVSDAADAEDVLQETLIAVYRQAGRFRRESAVKTWMSAILVRQAARLRRHRARRRAESLDAAGERAGRGGGADFRLDLAEALEDLSPEHREVIALREIRGLSYAEIAEALAVPRGTVESRLHRARQALRERLKEYVT